MRIEVYDSTLRDGAQAEGISYSLEDKLLIARRLDALGVDYIEGGWPNPTNPKDLAFFQEVKKLSLRAKVTAFGSTRRAGVAPEEDATLNTLLRAETDSVCIFGKSWTLHVVEVLKTTLEENLRLIEDSVAYLVAHGREVIYDAEHFFDGYKADADYAIETLLAAERGGARILVLCDTNGGTLTSEMEKIVEEVKVKVQIGIPFGIHTHNDAGVGVANTLVAVERGAVQVQGTFNGYGERCGNANLCAILPNLELKMGYQTVGRDNLAELMDFSRFLSEIANVYHDHRQPYVGESAFAHKGGVHIDAMIKDPRCYEHIDPIATGNERRFLVSDQAGGATIVSKLQRFLPDIEKRDPLVGQVLERVKQLEHEGYQFEAAEGSFELLARRGPGHVRGLICADQLPHHQPQERGACRRSRGHCQGRHRRCGVPYGRRRRWPGQRARPSVAQGAGAGVPRAQTGAFGGLQGAGVVEQRRDRSQGASIDRIFGWQGCVGYGRGFGECDRGELDRAGR